MENQTGEASTESYRSQMTSRSLSTTSMITKHLNSQGVPLKLTGTSSTVISLNEQREHEKRDLKYLNDRFASYIERVRYLEGSNKKLQLEIDHLRSNCHTQINETYEAEICEARRVIDDTTKDRIEADLRAQQTEATILKLKEKYNLVITGRDSDREKVELLQKRLFDNEAHINLFRRRLNDLQDEQNRFEGQTQELVVDIQRIKRNFDQEILTRIELENKKQNLEDEIQFYKDLHTNEMEQIQQHDLSDAVKRIREDYEQYHDQYKDELESSYQRTVFQTTQDVQCYQMMETSDHWQQQEEVRKLRLLVADSQHDIVTMRERNKGLEARIDEFKKRMQSQRIDNLRTSDTRDREIEDVRTRLNGLERNYDQLMTTKSSLDTEISEYRTLLEGEGKSEGLRSIVSNVEQQVRTSFSTMNNRNPSTGYLYPQSYKNTNVNPGVNKSNLVTTSRTDSTTFERFDGARRLQPASVSLNVQWIPVVTNYKWTEKSSNSRELKTKSCYENDATWKRSQPKAVTPPSSDYTDAYLATFACKPTPSKHIYRLTTPIFARVAPIPSGSTADLINTREIRSNYTTNTTPLLDSLDKNTSPFSISNSMSTPIYQPDSSNKNGSSVPVTGSPLSEYSPPFRNNQSSEATIDTSSQPSVSIISPINRTRVPYENVDQSISPSPTSPVPVPFSNDTCECSINDQTVLPPSTSEKRVDRPDTISFQQSEDIRSSYVEQSSPMKTPLLESSLNHTETEDLASTSSKPIGILEKTLGQYDSLINQISEILTSVSPLSSTVSSFSPGKSILDYQPSSDSSPILQHQRLEHVKPKHLIRDDSYDKIITAIADLDNELASSPMDQKPKTILEEEAEEYPNISSCNANNETGITLSDGQHISSASLSDASTNALVTANESSSDEGKQVERQLAFATPLNDTPLPHYAVDVSSNSINDPTSNDSSNAAVIHTMDKEQTMRNERPVSNESDIGSSYQSLIEESDFASEKDPFIMDGSKPRFEKPFNTSISLEPDAQEEIVQHPYILSEPVDQLTVTPNSWRQQTHLTERHIESSSSTDVSSSDSDLADQQTASLTSDESQTDHKGNLTSAKTSVASLNKDIATTTKRTITTSNVLQTTTEEIETSKIEILDAEADSIDTHYMNNDTDYTSVNEQPQSSEILRLVSLRQTITASATPLIETIQSVVASKKTVHAAQPSNPRSATTDQNSNEPSTAAAVVVDINGDAVEDHEQTHSTEAKKDSTTSEQRPVIDGHQIKYIQPVQSLSSLPIQEMPSSNVSSNQRETTPKRCVPSATTCWTQTVQNTLEVVSSDEKNIVETTDNPKTLVADPTSTETLASDMKFPIVLSDSKKTTTFDTGQKTIESVTPSKHTSIVYAPETELVELGRIENETSENPSLSAVVHGEQTDTTNAERITQTESSPIAKVDDTQPPVTIIENPSSVNEISTPMENERTTQQVVLVKRISTLSNDNEEVLPFQKSKFHSDHSGEDDAQTDNPANMVALISAKLSESNSPLASETNASKSDSNNNTTRKTIQNFTDDIITQENQNQRDIDSHDNPIQRLATALTYDSTLIENEAMKTPSNTSVEFRESSPTNTELDSFELIHALQGHSIVHPSDHINHPPEKSPSSTASSQITSSDRYVSYAIHEMGESSQDRLPAFPLEADIPIYRNGEEKLLVKPIGTTGKEEDDSTEFDATDNLTSYSDDPILQGLYRSTGNRPNCPDTSSTDEDVDEEFEQHDLTDIHRLVDKLTQQSNNSSSNEKAYQHYDLVTTPSSNDSSSSARHPPDDVYLIPGYPGLWRPSADNQNVDLLKDYDADDERKPTTRTQKIVRTSNSTNRPLVLQTNSETCTTDVPLRPDPIDLHNRPMNNFSFDRSESDSYHTCPSSTSKVEKQSPSNRIPQEPSCASPDENIFLIHEQQRGISLPVTMKINCDDLTLRLSVSTPVDSVCGLTQSTDLASPSVYSEPPVTVRTNSSSQRSSSTCSDLEADPQQFPALLTMRKESDEVPKSHISLLKSAKGPISISQCHPQGKYVIIANSSRSKTVDLHNWSIRQESDQNESLVFTFADACRLEADRSLRILSNADASKQENDDLIASSISSWHTGSNVITRLINSEGKECATYTKQTLLS